MSPTSKGKQAYCHMDRAGKGIRFYKHPLSPRPKNLVDGEFKDIHVSRLKF